MSTLADYLNTPVELEYKGTKYKLAEPTQDQQAQFARWLESEARRSVERSVDLTPERQRDLDTGVTNSAAAHLYDYGGELCCVALRTPHGMAKLVEILLSEQAVTFAMALEMIQHQLATIAAAVFRQSTDDPKAVAATLKALGLPSNHFSSRSAIRRSAGRKRSKRSRR